MKPVSFRQVQLKDSVLLPVQKLVSDFVVDHQWKIFNGVFGNEVYSPTLQNFRIIAGDAEGKFQGNIFQGGDLAKWLEGACIKLYYHKDAELEKHIDEVIDVLARAQQDDGYLGAYYQLQEPGKQFTNLSRSHELFFFGHLAEAAIAHHEATGKNTLMQIVENYADLIDKTFGADKKREYDGHPECEMALMRLYEYTGEERYLRLAKFFVNIYGELPSCYTEVFEKNGKNVEKALIHLMADKPVREVDDIHGHAVRAVYLAAGMADVARVTNDKELWQACLRLWDSCTKRKQYISGGIGSTRHGEAFGCDYDLPNDRTYQETCAGIGMAYFAQAMLRHTPKAEYADIVERCIYNCILSGISFDGSRFFYVNPLEVWPPVHGTDPDFDAVKPVRQKWYQTACCPPNLARFVPAVGGYIYTADRDALYVHQYMSNTAHFQWQDQKVSVCLDGDYPWQGDIQLKFGLSQTIKGKLMLRIPGWCQNKYDIYVNEHPYHAECQNGYAAIERAWVNGDCVRLVLEMKPTAVMANPQVVADAGKVAVMQGPILYCAEETDNGRLLHQLKIDPDKGFTAVSMDICGRILPGLEAQGVRMNVDWFDNDSLYAVYQKSEEGCRIRMIPYFAWGNRDQDTPREMRVWLHV